jgi:hypothetical protein
VNALIILIALLQVSLAAPAFDDNLVQLKVTWQKWERAQPWSKTNTSLRVSQAVVVEGLPGQGPALLTTAQMVEHATHVRVVKRGEPHEFPARVYLADREANLALVLVDDPDFFEGLRPVKLVRKPISAGPVTIVRWRDNQIESSGGSVARGADVESMTGSVRIAALRVQTDLSGGGWAEPVFAGGALAGIATSASRSELIVMPADFFGAWLDEVRRQGEVRPWPGRLGATFQGIRSDALAGWLGLDAPRGLLVTAVAQGSSACGVLRRGDVLLAFDGAPLDGSGNVEDEHYGKLWFGYRLSRYHAGERITLDVLREGEQQRLELKLRSYTAESWLVPRDRTTPPAYLMAGGLVFRELDDSYGGRSAELAIVRQLWTQAQSPEQRRVVVLSQVLADPYNLGYHGFEDLPIDTVNGIPVDRVSDVKDALEHPQDGYHVIRMWPNPALNEIVLDATTLAETTARIAASYGVPAVYREELAPPPLGESCD